MIAMRPPLVTTRTKASRRGARAAGPRAGPAPAGAARGLRSRARPDGAGVQRVEQPLLVEVAHGDELGVGGGTEQRRQPARPDRPGGEQLQQVEAIDQGSADLACRQHAGRVQQVLGQARLGDSVEEPGGDDELGARAGRAAHVLGGAHATGADDGAAVQRLAQRRDALQRGRLGERHLEHAHAAGEVGGEAEHAVRWDAAEDRDHAVGEDALAHRRRAGGPSGGHGCLPCRRIALSR
jgi:hypothetical protein